MSDIDSDRSRGHENAQGVPSFAKSLNAPGGAVQLPADLKRELQETRALLMEYLAQRREDSPERRDMEWERWIINGVLLHSIPIDQLFLVK